MSPDPWPKLAEPFDDADVKMRPGAATWDHKESCQKNRCRETRDPAKHIQFSYVDARAVAQRLDDVLTPAGWTFTSSVLPGTDIVHGRLHITLGDGLITVREDYGYPNSDNDDEPIKAAASDALKRCAVLFGVGRHLYGDNKPGRKPTPVRAAPAPTPIKPQRSSTAMPEMPEFPPDWDTNTAAGHEHWDGDPTGASLPPLPGRPYQDTLQPKPLEQCPIHPGEVWRGNVGDLYHKMPDGSGYCRPEGQPKKAKAR